jgi:hypothetical protein
MRNTHRLLAAATLAACCAMASAQTMLSGATATGAGAASTMNKNAKTFQAAGTTASGTGSATVAIECTVNGSNWDVLGTITLTLSTTTSSNSFTSNDRCNQHRANVTAISGTGASVSVSAGY